MKQPVLLGLAAALILCLTGCAGAPSWMEGSWIFDMDRTQAEIKSATANPQPTPGGSPAAPGFSVNVMSGDVARGMGTMLVNMMIPQLQGMELTVTSKDIITTVHGEGKALSYETLKKSSTECTVKESDGTVTTYYRAGDEIYSFGTSGLASYKFYMKRKG